MRALERLALENREFAEGDLLLGLGVGEGLSLLDSDMELWEDTGSFEESLLDLGMELLVIIEHLFFKEGF